MIIDRFEGDYAVCEDENGMIHILKKQLPQGCREGDQIAVKDGICVLVDNTADKQRLHDRMMVLFEK